MCSLMLSLREECEQTRDTRCSHCQVHHGRECLRKDARPSVFLIVLFVIPVVRGATVAIRRISHCTATCEPFICFFAMVGCFIHWCHVKSDETTRIQSEIWASFRSLCSSGAVAFCLLPTEKMMRKKWYAVQITSPGDIRQPHVPSS